MTIELKAGSILNMVWIIGGIAVAGCAVLGVLAWQVSAKLADLKDEVQALEAHRNHLGVLTGRLHLPHRSDK